jgi:hypothetical protein
MPVPRVPTTYIISFSSVRDTYKDEDGETMNLELILKDKVSFTAILTSFVTSNDGFRIATPGTAPRARGRQAEPPA